jgi:hypothetical protein
MERTRRRSRSSKSCTEYSLKIERRQLSGGGGSSTVTADSEATSAASECSLVVSEPLAAAAGTGRECQEPDCSERISPLEEFNTLYRNRDLVRASIKLKESNLV